MSESLLLRDAMVQEIQLELLRRSSFNAFVLDQTQERGSQWAHAPMALAGEIRQCSPRPLNTTQII